MRRRLLILAACTVPLLAIFALPFLGVSTGLTLTLLHGVVFVIHLIWSRHHERKPASGGRARSDHRIHTVDSARVGLALGVTLGLIYLGCALVMMTVPREIGARFYNNLLHGVDWAPILVWDTPLWHIPLGLVQLVILGWLLGAVAASLYNLSAPREEPAREVPIA